MPSASAIGTLPPAILLKILQSIRQEGFNKIQGRPFRVAEIVARVRKLLEEA